MVDWQALGTIANILLTGALVGVTYWYARTTKRIVALTAQYTAETRRLSELTKQATDTARGQLEELKSSRLAAVQPCAHAAAVAFTGPDTSNQGNLILQVQVKNLGVGPALGVRAYVAHVSRQLQPVLEPADIEPHGEAFLVARTGWQKVLTQPVDPDAVLWLEYHDMAGRKWRTRMPLKIEGQQVDVYKYVIQGVHRVEEQERTKEVGEHYIQQHGTLGALELLYTNVDAEPDIVVNSSADRPETPP